MSELFKPIKTIEIQGEPEIHGGGELELKIWKQGVTIIKKYAISEPTTEGNAFLTWAEWHRVAEAIKTHYPR
jgi:hypothetical protein